MGNEKAEELIRKYLEGTATPEEEALLDSWYMEMARQQPDMPPVTDYPTIGAEIAQALQTEQTAQQDQPKTTRTIRLWPRITAAAAVIIVLSIGSYLLIHKEPPPPVVQRPVSEHDIGPAGTKATLTLLDGQTLPIDSTNNNALAHQKNTTVSTANGQLIYSPGTPAQATQETYNTLTTRPGEHYSLSLPDGTLAWLNAASSITYPVAFNANVRKVKVTGEVYFQIAHDAKQPFQIEVKDQLIEDIGTRLNINAYDDEPAIYTTLLEGSIKLTKGSASLILKPGEEAADLAGNPSFQVKTVDADAAIAWKNGYFDFNRADIQTVMRELARWYGVQVVYKGTLPKKIFKGKVYRNINASEALQILSYFGAHFEIRDTTITVTF